MMDKREYNRAYYEEHKQELAAYHLARRPERAAIERRRIERMRKDNLDRYREIKRRGRKRYKAAHPERCRVAKRLQDKRWRLWQEVAVAWHLEQIRCKA